jgi:outer membrane immunogenic protein
MGMKKVLGLVGATLLFAGPALAADLGTRPPAYKAPAFVPVPSWAGFYLGIHGGYGWGHESIDGDISPFSNPSPKGGVFGGQIGYNWQFNTFVAGLEVDSSWADLKDSQSFTASGTTVTGVPASLTQTLSSKIDYLGSARVRAGFLLTPDWLFYGTGGVGWAHDSITVADTLTIGGVSATASESASKTHVGWAAGGGVEYKLLPNLLLRAEYLHYGFGSETYNLSLGDTLNSKLSVDVVRGGLSYKF